MKPNNTPQINITINGEGVSTSEKVMPQEMNDYISTKDLQGENTDISKDLEILRNKVQGKEGITDAELEKGLAAFVMLEARRTKQYLADQIVKMSDSDAALLTSGSYVDNLKDKTYDPSNPKTAIEIIEKDNMRYATISDKNLADMTGAVDLIPALTGKSQADLHDMLKDKDEVLLPIGKTGAKILIKRDHAQRDGNFSTTMKIVVPMHNIVDGKEASPSGYEVVQAAINDSTKKRREKRVAEANKTFS
nr:hypothetical protein [Candidatus Dojkabacteria bacterium]